MTMVNEIVLNKIENTLLATFQSTMTEAVLGEFKNALLIQLSKVQSNYVLCDLSGVDLVDIDEFSHLTQILNMASLMGTKTIIVGIKPCVAATIVDYDMDISLFDYALSIDEGLAKARL